MKRPFLAIIIGIIIIIAAVLFSLFGHETDPATDSVATLPPKETMAPSPKDASPVKTEQEKQVFPSAKVETKEKEQEKASAAPTSEQDPQFDLVRINPAGNVVIAGRASPNATVQIFDGETLIGESTADRSGGWVFVPNEKLSPGQHRLTLKETGEDGVVHEGSQPVFLIVPEPEEEKQIPMAVAVPEKGEIRPLQETSLPAEMTLSIDVIQSDAQGDLTISGKGPHGSEIRLYIDTLYKNKTIVGENDSWQVVLQTTLGSQPVTVRADQVDKTGKVVARVEVGFVREKLDMPSTMARVVVQPGNSLWRIARRTYGDGFDYVIIYQANKAQIRNPDLIFPGQVFMLPKRDGE